ncbi:hypothetical protein ABEF95_014714 [Exophiala dermatitidis]
MEIMDGPQKLGQGRAGAEDIQHRGSGRDRYRVKSTAFSLTASEVPRLLEAKLGPLMPYSLPLYRRIEFHLTRQQQPISESSSAKVFVAVAADSHAEDDTDDAEYIDKWLAEDEDVAATTTSPTTTNGARTTSTSTSAPWIAAYIDLEHYGQTQVWVFASWEHEYQFQCQQIDRVSEPLPKPDSENLRSEAKDTDTDPDPRHKSLMITLFKYIYTTLIPQMPTSPNDEWLVLKRTGKSLTLPYSRNKILFGTINTPLLQWIPEHARARIDDGYLKYVFEINIDNDESKSSSSSSDPSSTSSSTTSSSSRESDTPLPPGYIFRPMRSEHLQTVLDRSVIPRTLRTLKQLPSLGVFIDQPQNPRPPLESEHGYGQGHESKPVAWGFLGKDASLSSLHTEPEHRGKGLAAGLARELLRQSTSRSSTQACVNGEQHNSSNRGGGQNSYFAHSDVSVSNKQSRRVMEKLGGVPMWKVAWVEADLSVVLDILGPS